LACGNLSRGIIDLVRSALAACGVPLERLMLKTPKVC
jgi:hypothetical protein